MTTAAIRKRIVANLERLKLADKVDGVALEHLVQAVSSGDARDIAIWHARLGLTPFDRTRTGPRPSDEPDSPWGRYSAIGRPSLAELLK